MQKGHVHSALHNMYEIPGLLRAQYTVPLYKQDGTHTSDVARKLKGEGAHFAIGMGKGSKGRDVP